jgi:hypothetical protein
LGELVNGNCWNSKSVQINNPQRNKEIQIDKSLKREFSTLHILTPLDFLPGLDDRSSIVIELSWSPYLEDRIMQYD